MYLLTVLWLTLKRITHNWRLTVGLLFGLILATGIISSIPVYSSGSLQKSFVREWVTLATFRPPFAVIVSHSNPYRKEPVTAESLSRLERMLASSMKREVGSEARSSAVFARLGTNPLIPVGAGVPDVRSPKADLVETTNLVALSEIIAGRWYEERDDGVVEVVVDESTFERFELLIGDRYHYWYPVRPGESVYGAEEGFVKIPIEVVGLFRAKAGFTTADWIYPPPYSDRLFAHPSVFTQRLLKSYGLRVVNYDMQWVFDHSRVRVGDLPSLIDEFNDLADKIGTLVPGTRFWHAPIAFFAEFNDRRNLISRFLTALAVPVIGMIVYYLVLMASISVEHRAKEIVVMSSRGGGKPHIVASFLIEWFMLSAVAVAVGPFVGMFIARAMGASTGFLEFAGRTSVPAAFDRQTIIFSIAAVSVAVAAGMLPVFGLFRHSIVTYARHFTRYRRSTAWHRFFLDFVFLGIAIYGYSSLKWESFAITPGENVPADPVLFFVPVVGILGASLLVLRIYPLLIHLLRLATARVPGIIWRLAIQRLSRSTVDYVPLMLLLSVTLSLGLYSAATARTLAVNFEDRIHYEIGADLATVEEWFDPEGFDTTVREPPFYARTELPGVSGAARIFRSRAALRRTERWTQSVTVDFMAIEPYEFATTAWYRDDFGIAPFGEYLSRLSEHREGVIVSTAIYRQANLTLGEPLFVVYKNQEVPVYVVGYVDFWPGIDPHAAPFIVFNIDHFQEYTVLEPYQVWYDLEAEADIKLIVDELASDGIYVTGYRDAKSEIVEMQREPYRMGFFGMLGLGFICSAVVTTFGFFIHTFFSVKRRTVQFGALRSMGLMPGQVAGMLSLELLFTVGVGIALGFGLGIGAASIFLPFLQFRTADLQAAPPFIIVMSRTDIYTTLIVLGALFVVAVIILAIILSRMKIHQAIKLGEEG